MKYKDGKQLSRSNLSRRIGLVHHGIESPHAVYWNLTTALLYEQIIRRGEGYLTGSGPLVVCTGQYTGRAPRDKFIVRDGSSEDKVSWGQTNAPMEPVHFAALKRGVLAHLRGRDLYVQDCFAGATPDHRLPIRVITETAWHSLFAHNLFIQTDPDRLSGHIPEFTVIHAPSFSAMPEIHGTRSGAFIVINFSEKLVLIGGTHYAGEIKKSIFTVLNYLLPQQDILTMHCSANMATNGAGDIALFFGLSGTGKTTLSTDPSRLLIGDDEHAWSDEGIFNLEGGCYAKALNLSPTAEPEIYQAASQFGTILENVGFDTATARVNLADDSLTENTRAAYPIGNIRHANGNSLMAHPRNIIMLTADAFGVLPPIARLTPEQAVYHFLSGYTAKVAGTERGVTEPEATFSACYGEPFMALSPTVYAQMLEQRIRKHGVKLWLVNTGWSGGPYGVGQRIKLAYTRAMVHAALNGALEHVPYRTDPFFGIEIPTICPDVPSEILEPRATWADPVAYDAQAHKLLGMFEENFQSFDEYAVTDDFHGTPVLA